ATTPSPLRRDHHPCYEEPTSSRRYSSPDGPRPPRLLRHHPPARASTRQPDFPFTRSSSTRPAPPRPASISATVRRLPTWPSPRPPASRRWFRAPAPPTPLWSATTDPAMWPGPACLTPYPRASPPPAGRSLARRAAAASAGRPAAPAPCPPLSTCPLTPPSPSPSRSRLAPPAPARWPTPPPSRRPPG